MNTHHISHLFQQHPVTTLALRSYVVPVRLLVGWTTTAAPEVNLRAQHAHQLTLVKEKLSLLQVKERRIVRLIAKSLPTRLTLFAIDLMVGLLAFLAVMGLILAFSYMFKAAVAAMGIPLSGFTLKSLKAITYFGAFLDLLLFMIFVFRTTNVLIIKGKF